MSKRPSAVIIAVVGVVLVAVTVARSLFAVGPAFEEMIDDFRPWLADESIATLRADVAMLGGAVEEFQTVMAPALAAQLQMDPVAFNEMLGTQFPAVATGMAVIPEAAPTFAGIIDLLDDQQGNFAAADAIPTTSLPATTVPWGLMLLGLGFVGLGVWMYVTRARLSAIVAAAVAAVVIVAAFVLSLPGKASDADDLNEALKPVYTEETVTGAAGAVEAIGAMGQEMQESMLPGLAAMLGMDEATVQAFLGENFPAVAGAMVAMPEALPRFQAVVTTFDTNLDNYDTLRPVAFSPIIWIMVIGSLVVLVAAGLVLVRREESA